MTRSENSQRPRSSEPTSPEPPESASSESTTTESGLPSGPRSLGTRLNILEGLSLKPHEFLYIDYLPGLDVIGITAMVLR